MWKPRGRTVLLKHKMPGQKSRGNRWHEVEAGKLFRGTILPGVIDPDYYPR